MFFPIFVNLQNKKCIVIGGGTVAERKLEQLLQYNAEITVISPEVTSNIEKLAESNLLTWIKKQYQNGDLNGASLVFATADNDAVNHEASREASAAGALINVADDPDECDFIYPSIIKRGDLTIAISTGGKSPALCKKIRVQLQEVIGPEYEKYTELASDLRATVKKKLGSTEKTDAFEKFFAANILELISEDKIEEAKGRLENCI